MDNSDGKNEEKFSRLNSLLEEKVFMLNNQLSVSDKHFNLQNEKLNRDIERLKFDLTDMIDQK